MMLDCTLVAQDILKKAEDIIVSLPRIPYLVIISVDPDEETKKYIKSKAKKIEEIGAMVQLYFFNRDDTKEKILETINWLNDDEEIAGILVQLPLSFKQEDVSEILFAIDPKKDVDGFHPINQAKMQIDDALLKPCTPAGIMSLLDYYNIEIEGKKAVVIGRSQLVGRPMATLLLNRNASVSILHSKTKNLVDYTKEADILIVAAGVPNLITKDMVKQNSVVIDVGINREDKTIFGDVAKDVVEIAKVTPVPKGVGLLTVAQLMLNVALASQDLFNL